MHQDNGATTMRTIAELQRGIVNCHRCRGPIQHCQHTAQEKVKRYCDYWGKPVPSLGDRYGRLHIVCLAPASHGGNRTGRVCTGDRSGGWVFGALHAYGFANRPTSMHIDDGLVLTDSYITAAVHCAPPDNKPLREVFDACQPYLLCEIQLLPQVRFVVALGQIAFVSYLRARREIGLAVHSQSQSLGTPRSIILAA